MFSDDFIEKQRSWLIARRESKLEILKKGNRVGSKHSQSDIVRIDFALKRIESGQYGLCAECGSPIEMERLTSFMPETPFCADCQDMTETRKSLHN